MEYSALYNSPVGPLFLVENGCALTRLTFGHTQSSVPYVNASHESPLLHEAKKQLDAYFKGNLTVFDLPLEPAGTPFQKQVWNALREIPYGHTRTYAQIAAIIGRPAACRAVGGANHLNPIAIIIPCHRVIGANGSLVGYAGGISIKRQLLELEQSGPQKNSFSMFS